MTKEIQDTPFSISLKTLFSIFAFLFLLIGEYIVLQNEINEAKSLPKIEITRLEVELKNELLLQKFKNIEKDIERINSKVIKIQEQVGR